jgi:uncharacterized phage protein gp47/JayE
MALTTPATANEVIDRALNDVLSAMAAHGAKPSLKNSWIKAMIVAYSERVFDFYYALDQAALEALPDTAVVNLERWAAIWSIIRIAGAFSSGNAVATGVVGSEVPAGTILSAGDGRKYATSAQVFVETQSFTLSAGKLTSDGAGTATLETDVKHGLGSTVKISVSGAIQSEYNVTDADILSITSDKIITYAITGTPATPATGTILLGFSSAPLVVEAEETGEDGDQDFDVALRFESPLVGMDDVVMVDYDEIGGGADKELDADLRERMLDRIQNPIAHFNVAEIEAAAKTVAGVTRVWVQEITPVVGAVKIFFMRDNDTPAIPSGTEVADVDDVIQAIRPANTDEADVVVAAPVAEVQDFTFTDLQPATSSMEAAVLASLQQFFAERTELETNVDEDAYRSAIYNTVDPTNGDEVTTFTLSDPPGDITVGTGKIAQLGNVTF